ncbi:MarR family winged helix-turn-helix transcriptional regulator [Gulosibacter sp. 10]|uniref:MarR family winged helix-turn-helix transcriptional regulator n=1 Tax=Gulosibacter sp. 10 TaxID=1255570 RepID=UPI00097E7F73|nr:MarR family transcriptional regulator [Gulosibacter sp. 10]SJM69101.1 Transcriptional regulator, MarR family [Gulosibacter sp. 10]
MGEDPAARVRAALQRQVVHAVLGNERIAREHGLRVTDLQTLHLLVLREDVRTPRRISDTTGMPTSTVTKLLDRLEQAGFLRRAPDPEDRRRTRIELEEDAIAPLRNVYGRTDEEFAALSGEFAPSELEVVARFLDAVSDFYAARPDESR